MEVKFLSSKGLSALIEWRNSKGFLQRVRVPENQIEKVGDTFYCEAPEWGIPVGIGWSELIQFRTEPEYIESLLREQGIWSIEDFNRNPQVVTEVFRAVGLKESEYFKLAVRDRIAGG